MTDYSKIYASSPINSTAGRVVARGGVHWNPASKAPPGFVRSETYIQSFPFPGPSKFDLTGKRIGRLTVAGYAGLRKNANGAAWVVRCDCGAYEIRRSSKINQSKIRDRCSHCDYLERIKNGAAA